MALIIDNVSFEYIKNQTILENVNFEASLGNIISCQGYNGSGKTTFLKLLAGLLTPNKGNILYENNSVNTNFYKKNMAYIPPEPYVFEMLTGIEHIYLCIDLWDMEECRKDYLDYVYKLCDKLHILEHMKKKLCECSYGTKYKIYLAAMLARNPKLIYMDEPFNSMDEPSRLFIIDYLKSISKNRIIIFSSHQQNIIKQLSNINVKIENKAISRIKGV